MLFSSFPGHNNDIKFSCYLYLALKDNLEINVVPWSLGNHVVPYASHSQWAVATSMRTSKKGNVYVKRECWAVWNLLLWQEHPGCQIYGQTMTSDHHDELVKMGITPSTKGTPVSNKIPYVIFCAPPSRTPDYPGDVRYL